MAFVCNACGRVLFYAMSDEASEALLEPQDADVADEEGQLMLAAEEASADGRLSASED